MGGAIYDTERKKEPASILLSQTEGSQIGERLSQNKDALDALERQREALYRDFMRKASVRNAYFKACSDDLYYFSTEELRLAAFFFNKRLIVYRFLARDQVQPSDSLPFYGPADGEAVVVFHKGIHFSRCEVHQETAAGRKAKKAKIVASQPVQAKK